MTDQTVMENLGNERAARIERALAGCIGRGHEMAPYEMTHLFSPGVYWREILMRKDSVVVGREHTTTHLNVVLTGKCEILVGDEIHLIDATGGPVVFESEAGVRKTLYILEDMRWATIHPNPDNIEDVDRLEAIFSVQSETEKEARMIIEKRRAEGCLS